MNRTSIEIDSGCLYISGAVEFDDRPGPVRDALAGSVKTWLAAIYRAVVQAKEEGHLRLDADEHVPRLVEEAEDRGISRLVFLRTR